MLILHDGNFFLGFGPRFFFFLSYSCSSPFSSQPTKVGLPRQTEKERLSKKKKKVGVFMTELSFVKQGVSILK